MALLMKLACQTCQAPLAPGGEAYICSYECTFCASCASETHAGTCPQLRRGARAAAAPGGRLAVVSGSVVHVS